MDGWVMVKKQLKGLLERTALKIAANIFYVRKLKFAPVSKFQMTLALKLDFIKKYQNLDILILCKNIKVS